MIDIDEIYKAIRSYWAVRSKPSAYPFQWVRKMIDNMEADNYTVYWPLVSIAHECMKSAGAYNPSRYRK